MPFFSVNSIVLSSTCLMLSASAGSHSKTPGLNVTRPRLHGAQDVALHRADAVRRVEALDVALDRGQQCCRAPQRPSAASPATNVEAPSAALPCSTPAPCQPEIPSRPSIDRAGLGGRSPIDPVPDQGVAPASPFSKLAAPVQLDFLSSDEIALDFQRPGAAEDPRVAFVGVEACGDQEGVFRRSLNRRRSPCGRSSRRASGSCASASPPRAESGSSAAIE